MEGKNICTYLAYGSLYNEEFKIYPNIEDKNSCFKADQFSDIKDLTNCGYVEL